MSRDNRVAYADLVGTWLRGRTIVTERMVGIANSFTDGERANRDSPPGAKTILALSGPNGLGKSTLMRRWAATRYREWTGPIDDQGPDGVPVWYPDSRTEYDILPVCWINLHAAAKIKDLNSQILTFLGLPADGVTRVQTNRVLQACDRHRIRLMVIDDAHLLKSSERAGREVLDHLKHLNTELGELGATLVVIGANLEHGALLDDPQIAARLDAHHLAPYESDTPKAKHRWQLILAEEERVLSPFLPGLETGMLHAELAGHLWLRTQGYLGDLAYLLTEALRTALVEGSTHLTPGHLDTVRLRARAETSRNRRQGKKP